MTLLSYATALEAVISAAVEHWALNTSNAELGQAIRLVEWYQREEAAWQEELERKHPLEKRVRS
jgi:hypothetical protein